MAENVHDVAAAVLERLGKIDAWRFQKIVYYAQAWHLARHGEPLFDAEVQAWRYGPVVRDLYDLHEGKYNVRKWPAGQSGRLGGSARDTVDWVIERYGGFTGRELSRITHAEAPWRVTRGALPARAFSTAVIDEDLMRDYYARQVLAPRAAAEAAVESARLEGHEFDESTAERMNDVAAGRISADDAVAAVIARSRRA
jgi:uncharacterized phage-associated protein